MKCPKCGSALTIPAANVATQVANSSDTAVSFNQATESTDSQVGEVDILNALGLNDTSRGREGRLDAIVATYLEASENGQSPDPNEFILRHPEFSAELIEFFASQQEIGRITGELRTAAPPSVPKCGTKRFGNYELMEVVGRGGMGVVYKAKQLNLGRVVALKMILAGHLASENDMQRFQMEAEVVAKLDHPNIVPILEFGQHDGHPYFTMKLIDGPSLDRELLRIAQEPRRAACLIATLAGAVDYAHQKGLLHRDLKPSNIVLDADGKPFITDFGLAKRIEEDSTLTRTGDLLGTPSYMAPEQAANPRGKQSHAVDVYGLGAIFYATLTGRPPFQGETPLKTQQRLLQFDPTPPRTYNSHVDVDLETICLKCLEKDPSRRYGSAKELADDLQRWLIGKPIVARPSGLVRRTFKLAKRRPAVTAAIGVIACLAAVLSVVRPWESGTVGPAIQLSGAQDTADGSNPEEKGANNLRLPDDFAFAKFTTVQVKTPIDELIDGDYQVTLGGSPLEMTLSKGRDKIIGLYGKGLQAPNKVDGVSLSGKVGGMTLFFVPEPFACYRDDKLLGIWDPRKKALRMAAVDEADTILKKSANPQVAQPSAAAGAAVSDTAGKTQVHGYFTAKSADGGPWFGVSMSVPSKRFMPSEEVFRKIRDEETRNVGSSSPAHIRIYDPKRFTLIMPDGRQLAAKQIIFATDDAGEEFLVPVEGSPFRWTSNKPIDEDTLENLSVVWNLTEEEYRPLLKMQIDQDETVTVPNKKVKPRKGPLEINFPKIPKIEVPTIPQINIPKFDVPVIPNLRMPTVPTYESPSAVNRGNRAPRSEAVSSRRGSVDPEEKPAALLRYAERLKKDGQVERAKTWLKRVIDNYPNTQAAAAARELLAKTENDSAVTQPTDGQPVK